MLWTMSSEGKIPDRIMVCNAGDMTSEPNKPSSTRKYLIAVIGGLLALILVITAILVGLHLFTDTFHKVLNENIQTGRDSSQESKVDLTSNVAEYNIHSGDVEAQIVDDYNGFLTVIKLGLTCFVTPLNVSEKVDLSKFGSQGLENFDAKEKVNLVRGKIPIPDISFFNSKARSLCKGFSTYWAYQSCSNSDGEINMVKRMNRYCFKPCIFSLCKEICILI